MSDLKVELEILRDDLRRCTEAAASALKDGAADASHTAAAEFERLLEDIGAHLAQAESQAEDFVGAHPIAAVASAFLAGIAVGRLMGHGR